MTENNETKFVSRRTEALAMVLLTSRPDLTVMSPPANAGIDLIVSMVGNQGYYAWLQEPATSGGVPRLRHHANPECKPLDLEALQAIVDDVNSYFEGLSKVLAN
jgi:hypothetical protein